MEVYFWMALFAFAFGVIVFSILPTMWFSLGDSKRAWLKQLKSVVAGVLNDMDLGRRELGGYLHDTAMTFWIDFTLFSHNSGTWTMTVGPVANTYMTRRTAAAATSITRIPIVVPQNSVAQKGSYLKSIDIWFEYLTAAPTSLDALIWKNVLPADTAAIAAATAVLFSYDTGHDTAGERDNVDQHKMTLTLTTPVWLDDDDLIFVELTSVNALTTSLDFYGARANVTLRL
jgi:hypothetical protein